MGKHLWEDTTVDTRVHQWRRWLAYCDEEELDPLPGSPADVGRYLGYLWSEEKVRPASWDQYVSAINMIHVLHGLPAPGKHPLVAEIVKAGKKAADRQRGPCLVRGGVPASAVRQVCEWGLRANDVRDVRDAAMLVLCYCCSARERSVRMMRAEDLVVSNALATVTLVHRKGKDVSIPQVLQYRWTPRHGTAGPLALWLKWKKHAADNLTLWQLPDDPDPLPPQILTDILGRLLPVVGHKAPTGYKYSSHSLRIGACTAMQNLLVPEGVIARQMGWKSAGALLQIYFDPTHGSEREHDLWIFGRLVPAESSHGRAAPSTQTPHGC